MSKNQVRKNAVVQATENGFVLTLEDDLGQRVFVYKEFSEVVKQMQQIFQFGLQTTDLV